MPRRWAIVSLLGFLLTAAPAHAAFPGVNGTIGFSTDRDGNDEIYGITLSGTGNAFRLTNNTASDARPAYSPDGTRIALETTLDGDTAIYTMTSGGSAQTRISGLTGASDMEPAWSPDGDKIVFSTDSDIYAMNANGASRVNLTNAPSTVDVQPAWSPDGTKIAFVKAVPGFDYDVWVMNADGTGQTDLTPGTPGSGESHPNWSPNGARIAFDSDRSGAGDIYSMNPDGSDVTRLTTDAARDAEPAWSPDGTRIVFDTARDGNSELYEIDANGANPVRLTTNAARDSSADWGSGPVTSGVPRPKGASPIRASLVPAFAACTGGDRTHGPPLAFGSCSSPVHLSPYLTVGTPDANGAPASSIGSFYIRAIVGTPGPPDDSDMLFTGAVTDVRCKGSATPCGSANAQGGADYTGQIEFVLPTRLTDKFSGPSLNESATMTDFKFSIEGFCGATSSTSVGAKCTANSSSNAVIPGSIKDTKRAMFAFDQIAVNDGGSDGDGSTQGNSPFAVQGLFVP